MEINAVFEGGGVRGIALVGAAAVTEEKGYRFGRLAGTSAGSIVAALLAAGYSAMELKALFEEMELSRLLVRRGIYRLPLVGPLLGIGIHKGFYPLQPLKQWIKQKLELRGVSVFGDLRPGSLQVVATDISSGGLLVLPHDLPRLGIDPQRFPVAHAVAMSCAIPYFFRPVRLRTPEGLHYVVDGGVLSNFPVWLFEEEQNTPTFGFRLIGERAGMGMRGDNLLSYTENLVNTMLGAMDLLAMREAEELQIILIQTGKIRSTDFHITAREKEELYQAGREAALRFFEGRQSGTKVRIQKKDSAR